METSVDVRTNTNGKYCWNCGIWKNWSVFYYNNLYEFGTKSSKMCYSKYDVVVHSYLILNNYPVKITMQNIA